jgi:hypothetical protein
MNPDFSQPPIHIPTKKPNKKPFWSWPGCLLGALMIYILYQIIEPVVRQSNSASTVTATISNMKQVGNGFVLYSSDNDGRFPSADSWQDDVYPFVKNRDIFSSPLKSSDGIKTTVAMNSGLSKVSEAEIAEPSKTVLTFLSTQTRPSPHGGKESLAVLQNETVIIGYADTSVKYLKIDAMVDLVWLPEPEKGAK